MNKITVLSAVLGVAFFEAQALTLPEALALARETSPELRAARAEALAAREDVRSAALWSNPELSLEVEGLGGDNRGANAAEYSAMVSQEFPTSGKIRKRRAVSTHAAEAARFAVDETRLDFEVAVQKAFIDVLAQQELLKIRSELVGLAEKFVETARTRNQAGAASELEVIQAEVSLEERCIEKSADENSLVAARKKLAGLIGIPTVGSVEGDFFRTLECPALTDQLDVYPTLRRFQSLENQASAETVLAKSAAVPDVKFGAGSRYEEIGNVQSYLFSVSVPLPLFNRGKTETLATGFRADAARAQSLVARRELEQERTELLAAFDTAAGEAERYGTQLLPKAKRAYELSREGYSSGRYGWLELIEAQQMLAEVNIRAIEARRTAQQAAAELSKFIIKE